MRRIAKVIAVAAALGAFPALAEESEPQRGSDRDPFSQTYTGRDPEEVRASAERDRNEPSPCDRSCACGHKDAKPGGGHKEAKPGASKA